MCKWRNISYEKKKKNQASWCLLWLEEFVYMTSTHTGQPFRSVRGSSVGAGLICQNQKYFIPQYFILPLPQKVKFLIWGCCKSHTNTFSYIFLEKKSTHLFNCLTWLTYTSETCKNGFIVLIKYKTFWGCVWIII